MERIRWLGVWTVVFSAMVMGSCGGELAMDEGEEGSNESQRNLKPPQTQSSSIPTSGSIDRLKSSGNTRANPKGVENQSLGFKVVDSHPLHGLSKDEMGGARARYHKGRLPLPIKSIYERQSPD